MSAGKSTRAARSERKRLQEKFRADDRDNGIVQINVRTPLKWANRLKAFAKKLREGGRLDESIAATFPQAVKRLVSDGRDKAG